MNRSLLLVMTALALAARSHGETMMEEFPLADASALPQGAVEEVVYRNANLDARGFNRAVRKVVLPTLTVFHPAVPAHRGAALLICPGGGYQYVTLDREGYELARFFSARGITAAVLKYRLPDPAATGEGTPYPMQDAVAALALMHRRAREWSVDPDHIGILGGSAGGHLAASIAMLGFAPEAIRPRFVTLLYPVVCLEGPYVNTGTRDALLGPAAPAAELRAFSLERHAAPGLPPFFVVHAKDDRAVAYQNSEQLVAALRAQHVPAELMLVATGGHGFGLGRDAESSRWMTPFLAWIDRLP